jgi:hypothetical protein
VATAIRRTFPKKEIRVLSTLSGEERLEVLVHEMVHAAGLASRRGVRRAFRSRRRAGAVAFGISRDSDSHTRAF